jgi:hypothetical protein
MVSRFHVGLAALSEHAWAGTGDRLAGETDDEGRWDRGGVPTIA